MSKIIIFRHLIEISILMIQLIDATQLTQETPCLLNEKCLLQCVLSSGSGTPFYARDANRSVIIVACLGQDCVSVDSNGYKFTKVSNSLSHLEILRFAPADADLWSCSDGPTAGVTFIQVAINSLPVGPLTFGTTPCPAVSPAPLTCSLPTQGRPPATLTILDSSNQTAASSQTGSVTGTVTRGGQASCSVTWPKFPSFQLNISPVNCTVQVLPAVVLGNQTELLVREGNPLTIVCDSRGSPRPTFTWSHQGTVTTTDINATVTRTSLTFSLDRSLGNPQRATCTASNSAGKDSGNYTVYVQYLPPDPPVITGLQADNVVFEGEAVNVSCQVTGGNPPVDSVTLTCPRHSNTSQGDVSRLEFTAGRKDQGSCVCSAFHVLGYSLTASVRLSVYSPPTPPTSLQVVSVTSHSVTLTWITGDTGNARERWYMVEFRQLVDPKDSWKAGARVSAPGSAGERVGAKLEGLASLTSYVIRVLPRNLDRDHVTNSVEIVTETEKEETLSTGAVAAVTAAATFVLSVGLTLGIVCIVLRLRKHSSLPEESKLSKNNAPVTSASKCEGIPLAAHDQRTRPSGGAAAQKEDGAYNVLDPVSRDTPRPAPVYQGLAPSGGHGSLQSRDSQAYANAPAEEHYSSVANF